MSRSGIALTTVLVAGSATLVSATPPSPPPWGGADFLAQRLAAGAEMTRTLRWTASVQSEPPAEGRRNPEEDS